MQGSVTKRKRTRKDGTSYVTFRAQLRDPRKPASANANIEKVFSAPAYGGIANARKAANTWLRTQLDAIQKGQWRDGDAGALPLADVIEQWQATWPHKLAPKTQISYGAIIRRHIAPRWGKTRADAITSADVQAWVDELAAAHEPQTVHNCYTVLRGALRLARSRDCITTNPCSPDAITLPSKTKRRNGKARQLFLEPHELHAVIDALPEHWRGAVWVDALTGLRAGELWGLIRADVDLLHQELHVRRALKDVGGALQVGPTKTHARRVLSIPEECLGDLRAQLFAPGVRLRGVRGGPKGYAAIVDGADGPELAYVPDAHDPRRLLFTTPGGRPVSQGNFYSRVFHPAIRAAVAAATLPEPKFIVTATRRGKPVEKVTLRFHDLRHSAASFALAGAGNVEAALFKVQSRLGHKNIATTADIYGHLTRAADQEVAKGISAIVRRQACGEQH